LFDSFISPTEHRLPLSDVISNLLTMGPASVFGRLKIRATQLQAKFRRGNYEPHVHHPWGVQRDLARTYSPRTYPGQVILFKASQPAPTVFHRLDPPELGWQKWAAGGCEVHEIFAGHIGLLEEPHVQQVAHILSGSLQPQAPLK
jgi:thioesterase domain-containing protein